MEIDTPLEKSYDKIKNVEDLKNRTFERLDIPNDKLSEEWEGFKEIARVIDKSDIRYHNSNPLGYTDNKIIQNSNSVIGTIMRVKGHNPRGYIPYEVRGKLPGIDTNLFDNPRIVKPISEGNPQMHHKIYELQEYQKEALEYQAKHKELSNKIKFEEREKQEKDRSQEMVFPLLKDASDILQRSDENKNFEFNEKAEEPHKLAPSVGHNEILKLFNKHNNPAEDILYKHPSQMTQKEIDDSRVYSNYQLNDPEKRKEFQKKQSDYYDYYYSTEPLKRDETGRQIDPAPKHSFLTTPIEARSRDNIPMSQAFEKVVERTAPLGVKPLQKGLNHLYRDQVQKLKLKEDAVLGLKTVSRTKEAMGQFGVGAVKKSLGYGGLASLIEDNRKKEVANDTLKTTMTAVDPKTGGSFLQKGLNEVGKNKPDYQSLKEDNDIGPKTTSAFNKIKEDDEDGLMSWARRLIV